MYISSRRELDHLLVPVLHCTIALKQMNHVACTIGQDLNLQVFPDGDEVR